MILLICGGRDAASLELYNALNAAILALPQFPVVIVHGDAEGADILAGMWAKAHGVPVVAMPALWEYYGKSAGTIRNQSMLDVMKPTHCMALPGGVGTADMVRRCRGAEIPVTEVQL